ncbi:MAG TPA: hypothetical protein VMW65_10310, partial [Chloroflexota bacterium]|nr:hypothetical protein [Chloroflexota bacterium]
QPIPLPYDPAAVWRCPLAQALGKALLSATVVSAAQLSCQQFPPFSRPYFVAEPLALMIAGDEDTVKIGQGRFSGYEFPIHTVVTDINLSGNGGFVWSRRWTFRK